MLCEYPDIDQLAIDRAGQTWIVCDYADFTPAVYEGEKFVDAELVADPSNDWKPEDIGARYERGTLVTPAKEGKPCGATAQLTTIETVTRQEGRRTITETVAQLPEGWASSTDNPLDGGADFCPKHADRIVRLPAGAEVPEPLTDG